MNLSSGGLAILAIAAIWFLVFLPSFVKGEKIQVAEKPETTKTNVGNRLGERAQQALKARRGRTISATLTTAAFVVTGLSFLEFTTNGTGLPIALGATIATGAFGWLTVRTHNNYRALLSGSVKRVIPITPIPATKRAVLDKVEEKGWQPDELPKQSFLQTGAIEIVELAEVVAIEKIETAEEELKIDEILRRRRHVG
jgi:hypothetical protein